MKEGQTQESVGGMLEKIATILYANKSDEGDDGSWINSDDYYKVAEKIEKLFIPSLAHIKTNGEDEKVKYVAISQNDTELIQGWYQDAKGSNFQLIKLTSALPSSVGIDIEALEALQGLVNDVKNKPNDTRYATHIKIAESVIAKYKQSKK